MMLMSKAARWVGRRGGIAMLVWGWGLVFGACVSNPTPHPAADGTGDTTRVDDMIETPTDEAGCDDIGGFWDGASCFAAGKPDTETNTPGDVEVTDGDGVDAPDAPDTPDTVDAVDVEVDGDPGPSDDTRR